MRTSNGRIVKNWIVGVVLAVAVAGCDSASDVTLLENATTTTVPVSFDVDALVGTPFPGGGVLGMTSIGHSNGLWLALGGNSPFGGSQLWASNDGVIWEPREYPEFAFLRPDWLAVSPSGVWLMATSDPGSVGSYQWWYSPDGSVWEVIEPTSELGGIELIASVGDYIVSVSGLFATSEDGPYMRLVNRSSDGGKSWSEIPIDGEVFAVSSLGDEIIIWGSRNSQPTRWKLSTGWRPEPVKGLASAQAVFSVVEAPDGSYILAGGSPDSRVRKWFTSTDLETWVEAVHPSGIPSNTDLYQVGPFLVAEPSSLSRGATYLSSDSWVSSDGSAWTQVNGADFFELDDSALEFASDGETLIGVNEHGLVSDHPMVFSGPNFPGGWEKLTQLVWMESLSGSGGERFFVGQGKVSEITEGSVVPLPDAPVVFPDYAHLDVTDSALFVWADGEVWVFGEGRWTASSLPWPEGSLGAGSFPEVAVIERDGLFITLAVEDGWVQKYVSQDGLRWVREETEPLEANVAYFTSEGWIVAHPPTGDEDDFGEPILYFSIDGQEWSVREHYWLYQSVECDWGTVTVHLADGDVEFELPSDTTYLSTVSWSAEQVALSVKREGEPYLLVLTSDGEEVWARRDIYDPLIGDVWYDGEFLYGTNSKPTSGQFVYVWNPDAE